jgi:hypothetical protein
LAPFYFLLGLAALVLVAFVFSLRRSLARRHRLPYVADDALFTPDQLAFLAVLERAVGDGYRVYGKVRAAEVIGVSRRADRRSRERAYARINDRSFDFLVCTAETGAIGCAVNLAPRSRFRKRPPRDALAGVCAAARLPFVQFRESDIYSVVDIEEQVFAAMHAVRIDPKAEVPPRRETQAALNGLSEVIGEDDREPRLTPVPMREDRRAEPPRFVPKTVKAAPQVEERPRTEPRLALEEDFDDGPAFSIDDDLGDHELSIPAGRGLAADEQRVAARGRGTLG